MDGFGGAVPIQFYVGNSKVNAWFVAKDDAMTRGEREQDGGLNLEFIGLAPRRKF